MDAALSKVIDDRLSHIHEVVVPLSRRKNHAEREMLKDLNDTTIRKFLEAISQYRKSISRYHALTDEMNSLMQCEADERSIAPMP